MEDEDMVAERLRQGAIKQILKNLDQTMLDRHLFEADFNNDATGEVLSFTFKQNPSFRFVIKQSDSQSDSWRVIESPGDFLLSEQVSNLEDFSRCQGRIRPWVEKIIQELTSLDSNPDINTYRENLEKLAQSLPNPDKPFSVDEAAEWTKKFDDMVSGLEKVRENFGIQQQEINRLKSDLDNLKQNIHSLPKKTWLNTAGNKLLNVIETCVSSGVRIVIESVVKGYLGSGNGGS
jgi:hypothetical protein